MPHFGNVPGKMKMTEFNGRFLDDSRAAVCFGSSGNTTDGSARALVFSQAVRICAMTSSFLMSPATT